MGSYSAYKAQQVDRLTDRVKELEAERDRLRDGILAHKNDEDRWQGLATDKADDRLWSLLGETR